MYGDVLGSRISGWGIDQYFTKAYNNVQDLAERLKTQANNPALLIFSKTKDVTLHHDGFSQATFLKDWPHIWMAFAAYTLLITIIFSYYESISMLMSRQ